MSDLNLKPYDPLYPMRVHPYEELLKDQNASVIDKINSIIVYLNSVGKLTSDVVKNWNTVYNWVMNDGLNTGINNKLEDMRAKGEFNPIFNDIITKIGDIATLTTTDKTNLTKAVNELVLKIGNLANLTTTDKTSLVNAINEHTLQLAEKATKEELNALGQLKLDGTYTTLSDLQNAKPSGATGLYLVTADGWTYRWNGSAWVQAAQFQSTGFSNESIIGEYIKGYKTGKNLYNKQTMTINDYGIASDGTILANPGWKASKIPILPNTTYSFLHNNNIYDAGTVGKMAYLDSSGTTISTLDMSTLSASTSGTGKTFTSPANAYYIYKNVKVLSSDFVDTFQLELGNSVTSYEAYKVVLDFAQTGIDFIPRKETITSIEGKNLIVSNEILETKHKQLLNQLIGVKNGSFGLTPYLCTANYIDNDGTTPFTPTQAPKMIRTINDLNSDGHYITITSSASVGGTKPKWGCWYRISDLSAIVPNTLQYLSLIVFNGSGKSIAGSLLSLIEMTTLGTLKTTASDGITIIDEIKAVYGDWVYIQTKVDNVPSGTTSTSFYPKFVGTQTTQQKIDRIGLACVLTDDDLIPQLIYVESTNQGQQITSKWTNKKWYAIGDSITEHNSRTTKNYHDYIADKIGCIVTNYGIGGTGYTMYRDTNTAIYQRIDAMGTDAELITVFAGVNDFAQNDGLPFVMGQLGDLETNSFIGAVDSAFKKLIAKFPTKTIAVFTPIPYSSPWSTNTSGISERQVADAIIDVANHYSIPVLDLHRNSGLFPWNDTANDYYFKAIGQSTGDRLHPNDAGHQVLADKILAFLNTL